MRGEVDLSNIELLEVALQHVCAGDGARVVVDATAITFLSADGVAALVRAQARCQARDLDFALVATDWAVLRPLQVTGMDQRVKTFPSLDAARQAMGQSKR